MREKASSCFWCENFAPHTPFIVRLRPRFCVISFLVITHSRPRRSSERVELLCTTFSLSNIVSNIHDIMLSGYERIHSFRNRFYPHRLVSALRSQHTKTTCEIYYPALYKRQAGVSASRGYLERWNIFTRALHSNFILLNLDDEINIKFNPQMIHQMKHISRRDDKVGCCFWKGKEEFYSEIYVSFMEWSRSDVRIREAIKWRVGRLLDEWNQWTVWVLSVFLESREFGAWTDIRIKSSFLQKPLIGFQKHSILCVCTLS